MQERPPAGSGDCGGPNKVKRTGGRPGRAVRGMQGLAAAALANACGAGEGRRRGGWKYSGACRTPVPRMDGFFIQRAAGPDPDASGEPAGSGALRSAGSGAGSDSGCAMRLQTAAETCREKGVCTLSAFCCRFARAGVRCPAAAADPPGRRRLPGGWFWDYSRISDPLPGSVVPGSVVPGSVAPGSVVPGSVVPGSVVPGSVVPGSVGVVGTAGSVGVAGSSGVVGTAGSAGVSGCLPMVVTRSRF